MANGKPLLKEKDKKKKDRKPTISQLKHKLDAIFSQFIRKKYSDKSGQVQCYTCGVKKDISSIQNGHFVSRTYLATRYDEQNCRPQCVGCNVFGGGKVATFASKLENEGIVTKDLYKKAQEITKYFPYEEKIKEYEEKIKNL